MLAENKQYDKKLEIPVKKKKERKIILEKFILPTTVPFYKLMRARGRRPATSRAQAHSFS